MMEFGIDIFCPARLLLQNTRFGTSCTSANCIILEFLLRAAICFDVHVWHVMNVQASAVCK